MKHSKQNSGKALLAGSLAALLIATGVTPAFAKDDDLKKDARKAGHAIGSTFREIGHDAAKVGKKIGHGAAKAGKEIGHKGKEAGLAVGGAAKEGGKSFKRAVEEK